jgi:hypothetical protein
VAGLLLLTLCCLCVSCCCMGKMQPKWRRGLASPDSKLVMFHDPITIANIQEATGQFDEDHVLSRTSHGIVFKAILQVGTHSFCNLCKIGQLKALNAHSIYWSWPKDFCLDEPVCKICNL